MFSLLEKIKIGFTGSPVETAVEQKDIDYEDDGFLLVGETETEKSDSYNENKSVCKMSPTSGQNTARVEYNKMVKTNAENSNKDCFVENHTPSIISPLSGIPFKLAPHLEILSNYLDFEIPNIPDGTNSLCNYKYDFNFEKSLLRDLDQTSSSESITPTEPFQMQDLITF